MNKSDLATLIDAYAAKRTERLSAQNLANNLEKEENALKATLTAALRGEKEPGISKTHRAMVEQEIKPSATDWPTIHAYVKARDAFDLLQRRLTDSAVKLRWDDGIEIPGIVKFPVDKLIVMKL
jgi:hypothetical protein